MEKTKEQLLGEIRYSQRLCQRTSRLYRRAQTMFTFLSVLAGSAGLVAVSSKLPVAYALASACAFAIVAAINLSIRPAERIAQNEADVKKYAALVAKSTEMDAAAIAKLLAEARQSDAAEVEPLRDVAFNDVMLEINREDALIPLSGHQKLLAALA
jgi:hypothetical protein